MIVNGECSVFSPKLMEVFRKVRPQFEKLVIAKINIRDNHDTCTKLRALSKMVDTKLL